MGTDLFHGHRLPELLPAGSGPAAACVGARHHAHLFPAVFFGGFALDDNSAVQMLTALRSQPDAVFGQHWGNARVHGLRGFQTGILANVPAHDLAGRAAHHEHIALFQLCFGQQFGHCLPGLRLDLFFEFFCHKKHLVFYQRSKICTAHLFAACKAEIQPALHRAQSCHTACTLAGDCPLPAAVCRIYSFRAGRIGRQAE